MHIWLHFYLERPTFGDAQLAGLQAAIAGLLPAWSAGLRVAKNESMRNATSVAQNDRLLDAVLKATSLRRGLGSATLKGAYEGISFFLDSCESTLPPELNHIAVEIEGLATVEGLAAEEWARQFFESLVTKLPVRYANGRSDAEYQAKNIVTDGGAVRAVGTLLEKALPGVYWLNFLGAPYIRTLGEHHLMKTPACTVKHVNSGILIALSSSPVEWQTANYKSCESQTIAHIGPNFVFSRLNPTERTMAPDFRSS